MSTDDSHLLSPDQMASLSDIPTPACSVPSAVCAVCSSVIGHNAFTITCSICVSPTHLSCLVNQCKALSQKNKPTLEWLQGFIHETNLHYDCKCCVGNPMQSLSVGNSLLNINNYDVQFGDLTNKIQAVSKRIDELQTNLLKGMKNLQPLYNDCLQSTDVNDDPQKNIKPDQMSYAQITSANLTAVVENAVNKSIMATHDDKLASTSVMIFGLTETRNDLAKVRRLLNDDGVNSIVRVQRIGKSPKRSDPLAPVSRPIKVELCSKEDCDWVLRNSKSLINKAQYAHVKISKCLNTQERQKLKELRDQCSLLNIKAAKCSDGKNRYVVINEHIMKRGDDGKLERFFATSTAATTLDKPDHPKVSSPSSVSISAPSAGKNTALQPKNTNGGGHVAPI